MTETNVKRNYKDTVFRMLFQEKETLLSLYNAVNGTDQGSGSIQFQTDQTANTAFCGLL